MHAAADWFFFFFFIKCEPGLFHRESLRFIPQLLTVSCREYGTFAPADAPRAAGVSQARGRLLPAPGAEDCLFFSFLSCVILSTARVFLFSSVTPLVVSLLRGTHNICERATCRTWKPTHFFAVRGWGQRQIFHVSLDYRISVSHILGSEAAWLEGNGSLGLPWLSPPNTSHTPLSYPTETFLHSRAEPAPLPVLTQLQLQPSQAGWNFVPCHSCLPPTARSGFAPPHRRKHTESCNAHGPFFKNLNAVKSSVNPVHAALCAQGGEAAWREFL